MHMMMATTAQCAVIIGVKMPNDRHDGTVVMGQLTSDCSHCSRACHQRSRSYFQRRNHRLLVQSFAGSSGCYDCSRVFHCRLCLCLAFRSLLYPVCVFTATIIAVCCVIIVRSANGSILAMRAALLLQKFPPTKE